MTSEITPPPGKKAIFLDRDGVINNERGDYTWEIEDFEFNEGLVTALQKLQSQGYIFIVITNQGGISKGLYDIDQLQRLHQYMLDYFLRHEIDITDIYFCPHHPTVTNCLCRKPGSLMFERAVSRHGIDVKSSYLIGDRERDCEAAKAVGIKTILIDSNENLEKYLHLIE